MIIREFTDEFDRDISVEIYHAEDGVGAVFASITRDGGRLGDFLLTQRRVFACRKWDELNQKYTEMVMVNPHDPVAQILVGDPEVLMYIERFSEKLGTYRGTCRRSRR